MGDNKTEMADTPAKDQKFKLQKHLVQPAAVKMVPETLARHFNIVPLEIQGNILRIAMAKPDDIVAIEALASRTQMRIEPESATLEEVNEAIDFNYQSYEEIQKQISSISLPSDITDELIIPETISDAPIVKALTLIMDEAVKARASDIHIQPQENELLVRYRIDGTLKDTLSLPVQTAVPLISRIKILANMNIADQHRPQDGQFSITPTGRKEDIDIRVGTIPTVHGEMAALRLLDKSKAVMSLSQLGFSPDSRDSFEDMLKVPHGMLLVSGPTGAGKTTTLYAAINSLDSITRNIITVEDPVEYRFGRINQIQVNPRTGLTFSSGLRSILRLDPDVILVGEIRDAETANIAIQSALTGHLVLSSIHANDAVGVVSRLLDLGVEPFLIASALIGIVAQRMVRRICPECAEQVEVPMIERMAYAKEMGEERTHFTNGTGCKSCSQTGYQGRSGIFEILRLSDDIRAMVLSDASAPDIRNRAIKEGMAPLIRNGMSKVKDNLTTPSEVLRNAYSVS